ncbi:MAG: ATP/maltotriose-dependent transcriptional regulator MalT [Candidatus Azotimanducaceae bacterium]|jgi:ATP/maltotriose-dependent transcriptional regulator MalT
MKGKQLQTPRGAGILLSKLVKPEISGKLVPRGVFTKFAVKLMNGVKVGQVVAPAGYGKSTLLSQSFDVLIDRGVHCAWMTLDNDDNDPLRLLSHLLAALNTLSSIDFQLGNEHLGANSKSMIDYFVSDIVAKLEMLNFRHAIYMDDYHSINNPEVHSIVERLVLYSPRNTMFVIASRKEPDLAFKTLKMREEVYQLSTKDLAFALDESERFLNEAKQLGLSSKLVKALASRTEGWVAGLQLASLALAGRTDTEAFIEEFSGTDRDVTDYLGEAVLDQQSDDTRHFLLCTSLLDRMNASMANKVLGIEKAQEMLEHVEARNLFVIPLDRDRNWYRYHHLFRDFLNVQVAKEHPGIAKDIYQQALNWCVDQGFQHEAINYALRGGIYDQAIELIAAIAKDLIEISGEHWTLLHWVQQLPDDYALKRPEIAVMYSWSLVFSRQHSEARDLLEMLDRHCENQATQLAPELLDQLRCGIDLNMCMVEIGFDNTERSSKLVKEWLAANQKAEPRDILTAYVFQAYTALSTFETELGIAAADKAVSIGEEFAVDYLEAWGRSVAGLLKIQCADLDGAARHYKQGLDYNNRNASPHSYMGSLNTVLLAEVCYEQNDLVQAEALLQDRFEYIDNESVVDVAYAGYRVMAMLQFIRTGLDAGLNVLRLGKESAIQAKLPRLSALLSALEIHILLLAGESKEARYISKESGFDESQAPSHWQNSRPVIQEIRKLVQAELCLDSKLPKRAVGILDGLAVLAEESGRKRRLLDVLLLRSRAFMALQQPDEAIIDLARALEIGSEGRFYRVFLDAGEAIHQLARRLLKNDSGNLSSSAVEFLGKVNAQQLGDLKNNSGNDPQVTPSSTLLETLTKRERQMLDTIVTGETNKEIAEKLFISEQTVKWHLHQLYQKLGVRNRTSAIAKASALSLI